VKKGRLFSVVAVLSVLTIVGAACSKNNSPSSPSASGASPAPGGTYRAATQSLANTDGFDPVGEYYGYAWGIFQQMLIRGLYNYDHIGGSAGDVPQPDLATGAPDISSDGLTYTFHIRNNVKWGPPLSRMVTTQDIEYAFERINNKNMIAEYGNYYCGVIVGMTCDVDGNKPVSGISTPDATTIVFKLQKQYGDFLYRIALPASYPVPKEVAGCFTKADQYGSYLVSDGAYQIYGAENQDATSCKTLKPLAGFNLNNGMTLVRNKNFDPSTEDPAMFSNYLDGFQLEVDSNIDDIYNKIQSGELDGNYAGDLPPPTVEAKYATTASLQQYVHSDPGDRTWYVTMNLLAPPFDDPHVRAAVEYVIDRAQLVKLYGGKLHVVVGTTVEPPTVLPNTATYDPYPSTNGAGDLAKAQAEMKQSKYGDSSGMCTAPQCSGFELLGRSDSPWKDMNPVLVNDLAKIGLKATLRTTDAGTQTTTLYNVKKLIPISLGQGWGKDFGSPFGFDYFVFDSAGISGCTSAVNEGLVGLSAAMASQCGVSSQYQAALKNYSNGQFPSIDAKMSQCVALSGDALNSCFADLDKYLMETAITWVPWAWGQNLTITSNYVTQYVYDQNAGTPSLSHIAVDNNKEPVNVG
jgi:peptide/nickel transport system substrate-binding protein